MTRILIIDDHAMLRAGCGAMFAAWPDVEVVEAGAGEEGLALAASRVPDVVLLDLNLPGLSGFDVLKKLRTEVPSARVIVFSMYENPVYAARAIQSGARAYVSKTDRPETLVEAFHAVMRGEDYLSHRMAQKVAIMELRAGDNPLRLLTERELDVLRLLSNGRSMAEIADALAVSYRTVANVASILKRKLKVTTMAQLLLLATDYMSDPAKSQIGTS